MFSTRSRWSRQTKWRPALRVSAPGSRCDSHRTWKPLQMPSTGSPARAAGISSSIERREPGDRAAAQVVAVGEAAGQDDGVDSLRSGSACHSGHRFAAGETHRARGVPVVERAGEGDDAHAGSTHGSSFPSTNEHRADVSHTDVGLRRYSQAIRSRGRSRAECPIAQLTRRIGSAGRRQHRASASHAGARAIRGSDAQATPGGPRRRSIGGPARRGEHAIVEDMRPRPSRVACAGARSVPRRA